jgi:hypothetical protein
MFIREEFVAPEYFHIMSGALFHCLAEPRSRKVRAFLNDAVLMLFTLQSLVAFLSALTSKICTLGHARPCATACATQLEIPHNSFLCDLRELIVSLDPHALELFLDALLSSPIAFVVFVDLC